ncbi:MAG: B12-binding domain-containing radical SAM protein [Synechococcus sp.]|nr:B12-binding domain-containing radical SAM protein [Synechococcus sp.]
MRALLLSPRPPSTFWSFEAALELVGQRALMPPLGLITVAALLPATWQLRLVDEQVRPVGEDDWHWAELVILSGMLVQRRGLARLIAAAKQRGLPVAVGGPFVSSTPEAAELALADYLILDEGEITLPLFLAALERGERSGRFCADGARADVTQSPLPRFDLLDLSAYHMMAVQFSRGCPFQCEFCDIIVLYGRRPRTKEPQQLLRELEVLLDLGWRGEVFLVDDNFIGNKRNVRLLLAELQAWQRRHGRPFRFSTEASLDLAAEPELLEAMVHCGFQRVFLGIETPDPASLAQTGKRQNLRHPLVQSVETIRRAGLQVMAGFILGFDGEAAGAGERIRRFVEESAIPLAMVGVLQALPQTALWQRLAAEGRLLAESEPPQGGPASASASAPAVDRGVQTHLLNFRPSRPMAEIATEFLSCFEALYEPAAFRQRALRSCLEQGTALPAATRDGGAGGWPRGLLRGLAGVIWRQGLLRADRGDFWRLLLELLRRRPDRLADYLWLLLILEHMLRYRGSVREQVLAQLASPLLQAQPPAAAAVTPAAVTTAADAPVTAAATLTS